MNYLSTDFDAIKKSQVDLLASEKEKKRNDVNALYDSQETVLNDKYGHAVDETKKSYVDDYQKNAVQKLINERQVAESMSNLGLTDSGLNRTQQTAVQLSYANQKGQLDRQKQKTLDELLVNLDSAMATVRQNRLSDLSQVDTDYEELANSRAAQIYKDNVEANTAMYKAQQEAATARYKAQQENSNENVFVRYIYSGTKNGENLIYYRDGKQYEFAKGVNPYTGKMNKDVKNEKGEYDSTKAFKDTPYQPNNIGGEKLEEQTEYEVYVSGLKQKVWSYDDGETLFAWDGSINEYVDVTSKREELKKRR